MAQFQRRAVPYRESAHGKGEDSKLPVSAMTQSGETVPLPAAKGVDLGVSVGCVQTLKGRHEIVFLPAEVPDLGVLVESESVFVMSLEDWDNLPLLKSI